MFSCMRTTIQIDDRIFAALKKIAMDTGKTLSAVIQDALRESLSQHRAMKRPIIDLPLFNGTGVKPDVDLNDSASLLALVEKEHGVA